MEMYDFYPDQIQAHILMNELEECIPLLEHMYQSDFMPAFAKSTLAKCYLSEGMTKHFKMLFMDQPLISTQYEKIGDAGMSLNLKSQIQIQVFGRILE